MGELLASKPTGREATPAEELEILQGLDPGFAQSREVTIEIWEETLPAINLFIKVLTQWRTGATGVVGLDYTALDLVMTYDGIPLEDRAGLLHDVACLERGFLSAIRR